MSGHTPWSEIKHKKDEPKVTTIPFEDKSLVVYCGRCYQQTLLWVDSNTYPWECTAPGCGYWNRKDERKLQAEEYAVWCDSLKPKEDLLAEAMKRIRKLERLLDDHLKG